VVNFTSQLIYTQEGAFSPHWIKGWTGLRADLDAVAKRKNSFPALVSQPIV
jgi:hypothetical protein